MPLSGTGERVTPALDFPSRDGLSRERRRCRSSDGATDETQSVVADIRDECLVVFPVPGADAGDAFRHPFRYAQ